MRMTIPTLVCALSLFIGGCAGFSQFQASATEANAAAIAALEAQAAKLPLDSPERKKIQDAIDQMKKAQDTGFDPVALLLAFGGAHSEAIYGAAGLSALLAAIAAWQKRPGATPARSKG